MSYHGFIGVKLNNEFKIAQYFSFLSKDGLEEGINLISILKKFHANNVSLKSLVEKCEFVDDNYEDDNNPFFNDQLAAAIFLTLEKENSKCDKFLLKDSSGFLKEPLYCEYAYIIDLDKNILSCYTDGTVNLFAEYQLNNLPNYNEFIKTYEDFMSSDKVKPNPQLQALEEYLNNRR